MKTARIIGENVKYFLKVKKITQEKLAEDLDSTVEGVKKLCDGRLILIKKTQKRIADCLAISLDELKTIRDNADYEGNEFMHCMGNFKYPDNKEKLLELLDIYCDVKEALYKG